MNIKLIECRGKRLDNGEWVEGAYIPNYALDNPNEAGQIVDKEYGIHYLVDPKTVEQLVETETCTKCEYFTPANETSREECYYEFHCKISVPNRFKPKAIG